MLNFLYISEMKKKKERKKNIVNIKSGVIVFYASQFVVCNEFIAFICSSVNR